MRGSISSSGSWNANRDVRTNLGFTHLRKHFGQPLHANQFDAGPADVRATLRHRETLSPSSEVIERNAAATKTSSLVYVARQVVATDTSRSRRSDPALLRIQTASPSCDADDLSAQRIQPSRLAHCGRRQDVRVIRFLKYRRERVSRGTRFGERMSKPVPGRPTVGTAGHVGQISGGHALIDSTQPVAGHHLSSDEHSVWLPRSWSVRG